MEKLSHEEFKTIRNWMYRNARPLELAKWQYHFENGSQQAVLDILSAYQNEDGGFGHGFEADCWNPLSAPIQTWRASETLDEIHFNETRHPIIQGILRYLAGGADFNGHFWFNTVPSNNDYPHAPWWTAGEDFAAEKTYNPTASLAGFGFYHAEKGSKWHKTCEQIIAEAIDVYLKQDFLAEMHEVSCYIQMAEYIERAKATQQFAYDKFREKLRQQVTFSITKDLQAWDSEYICRPSQFFNSVNSPYYEGNEALAEYECEWIINARNEAGIWAVPWNWSDYAEEWAISKNWWKGEIVIKNMLILRNYGRL